MNEIRKSLAERILDEDLDNLETKIMNAPYSQPLQRLGALKGLSNKSLILSYERKLLPPEEPDSESVHTVDFVSFKPNKKSTRQTARTKRSPKATKTQPNNQDQQSMSKLTKGESAFAGWLLTCQQLEGSDMKANESTKKKRKKKKAKSILDKNIKNSVEEKEEIASETLARLFEQQGHYKKALKMYEKLSLINPQKSSFFAPLIENLKNKVQ